MVLGLLGAFLLPAGYRVAYGVCLVLSVLYSVPPFRLKAVPGADWIINMVGFGTLTPYAGWAATGIPLDRIHGLVLVAFCPLFAALYPLTQIYQLEEDRNRGDRTLALMLGVRKSLVVSLVAAGVAFALLALAGIRAGWGSHELWRWLALALCAFVWGTLLVAWLYRHSRMRERDHQRGMYHALGAWALTDLAVVMAWGI
jgi:4-hydroxybenzoate polyprenyltransferase